MARLFVVVGLLSFISTFCSTANQDSVNKDLVNSRVQRTLELSSHLPKISTSITILNNGKTSVRSFLFTVDAALHDKLSFIGALVSILVLVSVDVAVACSYHFMLQVVTLHQISCYLQMLQMYFYQ